MRFPIGLSASLTAYVAMKRLTHENFTPLVLTLEPLFACNLSCSSCTRKRELDEHPSDVMQVDECLKASRECGAPVVSISGGEPFLYPHLTELMDSLMAMRKYVYLCTNGTLLLDKIEKLKPSHRLMLSVRMEGPPEVHDTVLGKNGAYDKTLNGIIHAIHNGYQVQVSTVISKSTNMTRLEATMDKLSSLGVKCFLLSPMYSCDSAQGSTCLMSRDDIRDKFKDIDIIASRHRLADSPVYLEYLKGERELECSAWGNPTRNAMGWRSPCYLIGDRHFEAYREFVEATNWNSYGAGRDSRCEGCMTHYGYEPAATLLKNKHKGDLWNTIRWQFG